VALTPSPSATHQTTLQILRKTQSPTWLDQPSSGTPSLQPSSHSAQTTYRRKSSLAPLCANIDSEHYPTPWPLEIRRHDPITSHKCLFPEYTPPCQSNILGRACFISPGCGGYTRHQSFSSPQSSSTEELIINSSHEQPYLFPPLVTPFSSSFLETLANAGDNQRPRRGGDAVCHTRGACEPLE
jgi:hypothetical protein